MSLTIFSSSVFKLAVYFSIVELTTLSLSAVALADLPSVSVRLGSNINASYIREGMDVYFECQVEANPRIRKLIWIHNVSTNKKLYSSNKSNYCKICYGHLFMVDFLLIKGFPEYVTSSRIFRQPKAVESGVTENSGYI